MLWNRGFISSLGYNSQIVKIFEQLIELIDRQHHSSFLTVRVSYELNV